MSNKGQKRMFESNLISNDKEDTSVAPNDQNSQNEWENFIHLLLDLQMKRTSTSIYLRTMYRIGNVESGRSITLHIPDGVLCESAYAAIKSLDRDGGVIGMDLLDLMALFSGDPDAYYFEWKDIPLHDRKIGDDIENFLRQQRKRASGLLFWVCGDLSYLDFQDMHDINIDRESIKREIPVFFNQWAFKDGKEVTWHVIVAFQKE